MSNRPETPLSESIADLLETVSSMEDTREKVSVLLVLAGKTDKLAQYQESFDYAQEALMISRLLGFQSGIMEGAHLSGVAYYQTGLQEKALEYYFEALKSAESLERTGYAMNVLCDIGVVYSDIGEFDQAVDAFLKSIHIAEKMSQPGLLIKNLNNLGVVYLRKGDVDVATKYFMDLKTLAEGIQNWAALGSAHHNIGLIRMKQEKHDLALKNFTKSLKISRTHEIMPGMINNLISLGELHSKKGNRGHAIETYRNALEYSESIDSREHISQIHDALATLYKFGNEWENAYYHLEIRCQTQQTLHRENTKRHIENLHLHHRIEKQDVELDLTRATNRKLEELNRDLDKMVARSIESEQNLKLLWDNVQTGIVIIDEKNHVIVDVNKTAAELFGAPVEKIIGRLCHNYICPALEGKCPISDLGEIVDKSEKMLIRANGSEIPILKTVVPIIMNDRDHLLECFMDITEQKRTEHTIRSMNEDLHIKTEELTEANKSLEKSLKILRETQSRLVQSKKMAALGELVAGVAHEINTPIGVCITAASHLETKLEEMAVHHQNQSLTRESFESMVRDNREGSRIIVSNLQRAAQLIRSFKQVAVDQTTEEFRNIDLKSYLDEVLSNLHPKLKKTRHSITVNCPEDLNIFTNPGLISQIVTNLVMNSLKHGFANMDAGSISLDVSADPDNLHLVYRDNGCGMSKDDLARIYDPFFTTARGRGGTGLGMHLVYTIIAQQLGGTIESISEPGKRLEFNILLPRITTIA